RGRYANVRTTCRSAEQRLDVDVAGFLRAEAQQVLRLETEQPRHDHVGKLRDAHSQAVDRVVVQLAPVGDGALQAADACLQLPERFVGLQRGIVFGQREQPAKSATQAGLRRAQASHVGRLAG